MDIGVLKNRYLAVSLWITNTVVVFVALNLILAAIFGVREFQYWQKQRRERQEIFRPRPGQPKDNGRRTDYQLKWIDLRAYEGLDLNRVERVLENFYAAESLGYRFTPYVHYSSVPIQSETLNIMINSAGFDHRRIPGSGSGSALFLFGGSTTLGTHVADDWTYAAELQKHVPRMDVVNFGRANYSWYQEMVLFQRLLHAGFRPKVAIFMDGVNIFSKDGTPVWSDRMKFLWEDTQLFPNKKSYPDVIPIFRLVNYLARKRESKRVALLDSARYPASTYTRSFLESYKNIREQIRAIASRFGVKVLFVIQPNRAVRCDNGQYGRALPQDYTSTIRDFYSNASSLVEKDTLDYSGMCEEFGSKEIAFVDDVHYSPKFNALIGKRLAKILKKLS